MTLNEFARLFDCLVPEILEKLRNERSDFWRWWWTQFASEQVGLKTSNLRRCLSPFYKLADRIDIEPFLQEIAELPEGWMVDTERKKIAVQRHTDSIFLRGAAYKGVLGVNEADTIMD